MGIEPLGLRMGTVRRYPQFAMGTRKAFSALPAPAPSAGLDELLDVPLVDLVVPVGDAAQAEAVNDLVAVGAEFVAEVL